MQVETTALCDLSIGVREVWVCVKGEGRVPGGKLTLTEMAGLENKSIWDLRHLHGLLPVQLLDSGKSPGAHSRLPRHGIACRYSTAV